MFLLPLLLATVLIQAPAGSPPEPGVETGARVYRSQCAACHGINAEGYRGPELTRLRHGDDALFAQIRRGIPGTAMGPSNLSDAEIRSAIEFLNTLTGPARIESGDADNGQRIFFEEAGCANCHSVHGRGNRFGPDLSFVTLERPRDALVRSIRSPGEVVGWGYEGVQVVTRRGERIGGLRKNEDAFSIQILDARGELRAFMKSDLQEVRSSPDSPMPAYPDTRLSDSELEDILRFLAEAGAFTGGGR